MSDRRHFVLAGAGASMLLNGMGETRAQPMQESAEKKQSTDLRVAVMGLSRGQSLANDFAAMPGVEVTYLCDVDERRMTSAAKQLNTRTGTTVRTTKDFRTILDDPSIDILVCAAPNHWHAPATIMACKAGKHVYVEKPCSHNPQEGEWMVEAAAEFERVVQMGTQRRSAAGTREAMQRLHDGKIGEVHLARCYYHNLRGPIGKGNEVEPPKELDYELWQGPAERVPFRSNVVHTTTGTGSGTGAVEN